MKLILALILRSLLYSGCGSSQLEIIDNGFPGQIKVSVFFDANGNGTKDQSEPGLIDRVSISLDISCPPSDVEKLQAAETDSNGETVYGDLKPGRYCVDYIGDKEPTTKLAFDVYLSSEQEIQAYFGIADG